MSSQVEPLSGQAQNGESSKAIQACNDYLRLGIGRSLRKLLDIYIGQATDNEQTEKPPTDKWSTLSGWSTKYDWVERAKSYDAVTEDAKNARRREVMESGLALDYERVIELKRMAAFLIGQVYEQGVDGRYHNVWLPDVKQIGSGEYAERVDIERFNGEIIAQLRGTLDDLAKEVGGRKQKTELTGKDGAELTIPIAIVKMPVDEL